jgi:hypothetical protein
MSRIFLLSPAHAGGPRAQLLMSERADFPLARQLRSPAGAALGEVFRFLSGLYFRGKLTYAEAFARPPRRLPSGVFVITTAAGVWPAETPITLDVLQAFAAVDLRTDNPAYVRPLEQTVRELAEAMGRRGEVVLLGSIASPKYVDVLTRVLGDRLLFPPAFVGRGDMSRGGLLLRCVREGCELEYVPVAGAVRHGPRPPKLEPLPRSAHRAPTRKP